MAKKEKKRVVNGRLIRVFESKRPKFTHVSKEWDAVQVEDVNGHNSRCLLFTAGEIAEAQKRAANNVEELTKEGFIIEILE